MSTFQEKLNILADIAAERVRQIDKWGEERDLPDGTKFPGSRDMAVAFREDCQSRFDKNIGTWSDILLEEVYEALDESDWHKLRAELIQVAAVCVAWIEDGDERVT